MILLRHLMIGPITEYPVDNSAQHAQAPITDCTSADHRQAAQGRSGVYNSIEDPLIWLCLKLLPKQHAFPWGVPKYFPRTSEVW